MSAFRKHLLGMFPADGAVTLKSICAVLPKSVIDAKGEAGIKRELDRLKGLGFIEKHRVHGNDVYLRTSKQASFPAPQQAMKPSRIGWKIKFEIPGEPVAKARPRVVNGHAFTPKGTKTFEKAVRVFAEHAMKVSRAEMLTGAVRLTVKAFFGIRNSWTVKKKQEALDGSFQHLQRPDWDNVFKAVSDALNGICFKDDSQVIGPGDGSGKFWAEYAHTEVIVEEVV